MLLLDISRLVVVAVNKNSCIAKRVLYLGMPHLSQVSVDNFVVSLSASRQSLRKLLSAIVLTSSKKSDQKTYKRQTKSNRSF
ncbi:hypothetical protein DC094_07360 [Pelagibaculum spongiae]|uniref:Uncharacterized protein n=1 Tax=Pelagibaculum spongiae TaxID=2080658 RepID=A0A2V1H1T4_9GAMM|nr:hypothetical protein DC094_07360 [Pelagibaculum spongiae]